MAMNLGKLWLFIRVKAQTFAQSLLVQLLSFTLIGKWDKVDKEYSNLIRRGGVFLRGTPKSVFELSSEWSKCYQLWNQGNVSLATRIRRSILEQLYDFNKVSRNYYPPMLSDQYFGPIGHHAFTGIHIAAQRIGIIPSGERIGIIGPELVQNDFLSLYKSQLRFVNYVEGKGFTEMPNNWHLAERIEMVRGHDEFIESYELVDLVFRTKESTITNSFFEFDSQRLPQAYDALHKFGFKEGDWFVGLHIRDGSTKPSLRNQNIENYLPAVREIIARGGWVIRIGGTEMPPLPKLPQLIDLVTEPKARKDLHLFVLSKAKFFIGTCSGPQYFPSLFGVPTLFTNQIGIGRSILTFSKHSFHLPKIYLKRDKSKPSFAEILSSPFGFGELTLKEYAKLGIYVQENTAEEILEAVIEMFNRISGGIPPREAEFDARVSAIRSQFEWTAKGRFSNSYLQANENWFLR